MESSFLEKRILGYFSFYSWMSLDQLILDFEDTDEESEFYKLSLEELKKICESLEKQKLLIKKISKIDNIKGLDFYSCKRILSSSPENFISY